MISISRLLYSVDGKRVEKEPIPGKDIFIIPNKETADNILRTHEKGPYKVATVERKEKRRNPVSSFYHLNTAARSEPSLWFSCSRTMSIAQGLYEGVDLGNEGAEGFITYMRTDLSVLPEALGSRAYIKDIWPRLSAHKPECTRQKKVRKMPTKRFARPTLTIPRNIKIFDTRTFHALSTHLAPIFCLSNDPAIYDTVSAIFPPDKEHYVARDGIDHEVSRISRGLRRKTDDEKKKMKTECSPDLQKDKLLILLEFNR